MEDPLSPFRPAQKPPRQPPSRKSQIIKSSPPKTDQNFIDKVVDSTVSRNTYWDKTRPASESMAIPSVRKAAEAFHDAKRRRRMKEAFSNFCNETSFTALTRIHNASSWARKVGWLVLLLVMLSWLSVQCYWLLAKYFSFPMEVKLDMQAARELNFPSVTVCNLNPIKLSQMLSLPEFQSLQYYTDKISNDDVLYDYHLDHYWHLYSTPPPMYPPSSFATGSHRPGSPGAGGPRPPPPPHPPGSPYAPTTPPGPISSGSPYAPTTPPGPSSSAPPTSAAPSTSPHASAGRKRREAHGQTSNQNPFSGTSANQNPSSGTSANQNPFSGTSANQKPASKHDVRKNQTLPKKRRSRKSFRAQHSLKQTSGIVPPSTDHHHHKHNYNMGSDEKVKTSKVPGLERPRENPENNHNTRASATQTYRDGFRNTVTEPETVHHDDAGDTGTQEAEWRALEMEIFNDGGGHGRQRRSADNNNTLDALKNNSFNKWNALGTAGINISFYETRGTEYLAAMAYATLAAQLPAEVVKASGVDLNDFLISCTFSGFSCSPSNFSYFHNHKYGNCYTFNAHDSNTTLETKFSGPQYGLTLELYLQQDEYVAALAPEAGVRVVIHPKGTVAFPEDDGVSITPAQSTSISIREIEMNRLGPPHGTCDDTKGFNDMYVTELDSAYTKLSCLKSCYQDIIQRHCNCNLPMYLVTDRNNVCNMTEAHVEECTSSLPEKASEEYRQCDLKCPQPCFGVEYETVVSSAAWPSKAYERYLQTKLQQSNYLLIDSEIEEENFAKLNVFFKDLIYEKVEQQKAYESQNLISDIGGQLGLWLGLSAITIGELCGLVLSLFRSVTSVEPNKRTTSSSNDKTTVVELSPVFEDKDSSPNDLKARSCV